MNKSHLLKVVALGAAVIVPIRGASGQMSVSPFLSMMPSVNGNPLAGLGLTFGGTTGLAFRGSGDLSIANTTPTAANAGYRPWGADADAMLFLSGLGGGATTWSHSTSPYVFAGLALTGGDSAGANVVHNGWSYGAGATIPLGLDADLFGEARFRMAQYMLPTARSAYSPRSEFRFGLSFHIGGDAPARRGRRYDDDDVRRPAPAPAPVTVVYPPAPPAPVIIQQSAPAPVVYQPPVATAPVVIEQPAPVVVERPVVVEQPVIVDRPQRPIVIAPTISFPRVIRGGDRDDHDDRDRDHGAYIDHRGRTATPVVVRPAEVRPTVVHPATERYIVPTASRPVIRQVQAETRNDKSDKAKDRRRPN